MRRTVVGPAPGPAPAASPPQAERLHGGRPGTPPDAIFEAVLALLVEAGYEALTVDAVAARAHVGKGTVYRRWEGKPRLVVAALRSHAEHTRADPDAGSLRADLLACCRHLNTAEDRTGGLVAAVAHAVQQDPELAAVVATELGAPIRGVLVAIVARAVDRGDLAAAPPDTDLIYDVLPLMVIAQRMFTGRRYPDAALEHIVDAVLLPILRAVGDRPHDHQPHDDRPHDHRSHETGQPDE